MLGFLLFFPHTSIRLCTVTVFGVFYAHLLNFLSLQSCDPALVLLCSGPLVFLGAVWFRTYRVQKLHYPANMYSDHMILIHIMRRSRWQGIMTDSYSSWYHIVPWADPLLPLKCCQNVAKNYVVIWIIVAVSFCLRLHQISTTGSFYPGHE